MRSATNCVDASGTTWSCSPARTRVGTEISPSRSVTKELGSRVALSSPMNRSGVAGRGWRRAAAANDPDSCSLAAFISCAMFAKNVPHNTAPPPAASGPLVNEFVAAAHVDLTVHYMRKDRRGARIFPFVKLGNGKKAPVRYRISDLDAAVERLVVGQRMT